MTPAQEKRSYFEELLAVGVASLHLDARAEGVRVPPRFARQEWLVLNYSYRYGLRDFAFDDETVLASLSFSGQPFPCRVPWSAVFAITNEARSEGRVWEADLPDTLRQVLAEAADDADTASSPGAQPDDAPPPTPPPTGKPRLHVVAAATEPPDEPPTRGDPPEPSPPRRGHLRRVQ